MIGEYIKKAAVQVNAKLFVGKNHSVCIKKLKSATTQGFIATTGALPYDRSRFVGRKEALEIAIEAGQEINKHSPKNRLCSEDLAEDKRFNHE